MQKGQQTNYQSVALSFFIQQTAYCPRTIIITTIFIFFAIPMYRVKERNWFILCWLF